MDDIEKYQELYENIKFFYDTYLNLNLTQDDFMKPDV